MRDDILLSEKTIRGDCSLFVCRLCRTKYGWEHQRWCELTTLTEPSCKDCRYFREQSGECAHPAKKTRKETPYEKAQSSV